MKETFDAKIELFLKGVIQEQELINVIRDLQIKQWEKQEPQSLCVNSLSLGDKILDLVYWLDMKPQRF